MVVYVDGCFWHGCPLHFRLPRKNVAFWKAKIAKNKARDKRQRAALEADGWTVIPLWEHTVKRNPRGAARKVVGALPDQSFEAPKMRSMLTNRLRKSR